MRAAKSLQLVANGKCDASRQQLLQKFLDLAVADDVADRNFADVKLNRRCPVTVVSGLDVATLTLITSVIASQQREDYRALIERAQRLVQLVASAGNAPAPEPSNVAVPQVTVNSNVAAGSSVSAASATNPNRVSSNQQQKLPG